MWIVLWLSGSEFIHAALYAGPSRRAACPDPETQRAELQRYVYRTFDRVSEYVDYSEKRLARRRLLLAAERYEIDFVLVWDVHCLAPSTQALGGVMRQFRDLGVKVLSLQSNLSRWEDGACNLPAPGFRR